MKVFEENIAGLFSIWWTSVGINGIKNQNALSSETIGHLKKIIIIIYIRFKYDPT